MANALYDKGREGFLAGSFSWSTSPIQIDILDGANYTPNLATHEFRNSVATNSRITNFGGTLQTLANKTVAAGVADGDDVTFTGLASVPTMEYVQIFADLGTDAQDRLIALIDTATNLPTPAGVQSITVQWDNGANRIFKL